MGYVKISKNVENFDLQIEALKKNARLKKGSCSNSLLLNERSDDPGGVIPKNRFYKS